MYTEWSTQVLRDQIDKMDIAIRFAESYAEEERLNGLKRKFEVELDARRARLGKPPVTDAQRRARKFRDEVDAYVGLRVRNGRVIRNVSQKALGAAIGLTQAAISDVENGRRSLTVCDLLRVAIELAQPVSFFLEPRYPGVVQTGWERSTPAIGKLGTAG